MPSNARATFAYWTACLIVGLLLGVMAVMVPPILDRAAILTLCLLGVCLAASAIVLLVLDWVEP